MFRLSYWSAIMCVPLPLSSSSRRFYGLSCSKIIASDIEPLEMEHLLEEQH